MKPCPVCAEQFDPLSGGYAPDGTVVCADCAEKQKARAAVVAARNTGSAFVGACGSVLIALASFVVQIRFVFFLMPLMAIGFGAGTAYAALTNAEVKRALGWKTIPTILIGALGVLLGITSLIFGFSQFSE